MKNYEIQLVGLDIHEIPKNKIAIRNIAAIFDIKNKTQKLTKF
jgi:hypothetical protein